MKQTRSIEKQKEVQEKYSKNTEERTGNIKISSVKSFLPTVIDAGLAFKKDFQGVFPDNTFRRDKPIGIEIQNAGQVQHKYKD